jgi:NADH-quinone oxidoreductase subunit J
MIGSEIVFFLLAGLFVVASLLVIFQRNVVHSAIALIAALFLNAILFLTLYAPMVAALQVLVYAGAIMVLFLFVIMLLSPAALERRRKASWVFGSLVALLLASILTFMTVGDERAEQRTAVTEAFGSPEQLAKSLFTDFFLPFEIASVLLLVAIIGTVVLAKRER